MPSSAIRWRMFTCASAWTGRPASSIRIVITPFLPCDSSFVTLPTLTPAIRTGEPTRISVELRTSALIV